MKKDKKPKTKDVYRLWWEYLKRSEKYRRHCENPVKEPYKGFNFFDKYLSDFEDVIPNKTNKRTKKQKLEDDWWPLFRTWETFGNVFNGSFEEWWKKYEKELRKNVIDLEDRSSYDDDTTEAYYWKIKKITPAMGKTLADMIHYAVAKNFEVAVVAIPLTGDLTMKEYSQQISKILEKRRKEKLPRIHNFSIRYNIPIGRVRYDELKRYLQVYDMKQQNMSIREIIKKISPGKNDGDVNVHRQVYSDIKKAEKVIENVEQGYFPSKRVPSGK